MRPVRAFPVLALALLVPLASASRQDAEFEKLWNAARTGRAMVRPQAAVRLVRHLEGLAPEAREPLLAEIRSAAGDTPEQLATLGSALIEELGALGDGTLRARLWAAVDDRDFPWRPYAARSLVRDARAAEAARFEALLEDPIAPVRAAAVDALGALDHRASSDAVARRLADEDDRVRRAAAERLVRWDRPSALWWLLEDLAREDAFFDRPTGEQARFASAQALGRLLGDAVALHPELVGEPARPALEALRAAVTERAGPRPDLPAIAEAGAPPQGEVLGLELRSCRRGEFFLRWTADDELWVGQGRPAHVRLPAGTVARLLEAARARTAELDRPLYGQPGCDLEQLSLRDGADGTRSWIVAKGPDAIEGLRPAPLGALVEVLLATVPDDAVPHGAGDERLDRLRSRCRAALDAIGGR